MSGLATLAAKQAKAALKRYGCPVSLRHTRRGTGADSTGDVTTTVATHGLFDAQSAQNLGYKFGADLVRAADVKLTLPGGLSPQPVPGDAVTAGGKTWAIVAVHPVYVGADIVTYELLVRS